MLKGLGSDLMRETGEKGKTKKKGRGRGQGGTAGDKKKKLRLKTNRSGVKREKQSRSPDD